MTSIDEIILSSDTDELVNKKFPVNPFPDVNPKSFHKLNKKGVTEDFVEENLRFMAWDVYKPFNDTGIDRIINKNICPNGHTPYNQNLNANCPVCDAEPINITRYIQVKTREVKGNENPNSQQMFGYTLKTKDFRTDPRHVFLFYSDHTQDFLFISVLDYLSFFYRIGYNHFATPTFKQGNGKINNLKYDSEENEWYFSTGRGINNQESWEMYRNVKGLERIQNPNIDLDLDNLIEKTKKLHNSMFRVLEKGRTFTDDQINEIQLYLECKDNIVESRNNVLKYLSKVLSPEVKNSVNNSYWFKYKGLEIP